MKHTTTEIFIQVEETICIIPGRRKMADVENENHASSVIEICPHCHKAIFASRDTEIKGDKVHESS